jgi:hypothetical protein
MEHANKYIKKNTKTQHTHPPTHTNTHTNTHTRTPHHQQCLSPVKALRPSRPPQNIHPTPNENAWNE